MRTYKYMLYYKTSKGSGNRRYGLQYRITGLTLKEFEKQLSDNRGRITMIAGIQLLRKRGW